MTDKEKLEICVKALQEIPHAYSPEEMLHLAIDALKEIGEEYRDGTVTHD